MQVQGIPKPTLVFSHSLELTEPVMTVVLMAMFIMGKGYRSKAAKGRST